MATKDVGNLRTRLSWESDDANRSLEGFRKDLKGLRSEMNLARSGGREYTQSLKGMQQQSDILSRRFKTQEERVKELKKRYDESVKAKGEDANQTRDLASQLNNATAEMNKTEGQLQRLNEEINRMKNPWNQLGDQFDQMGDKLKSAGRSMTEFGKSYSMRVTAPIVAGGVAAFKASMDYESAFAGVRKTVDATEEEFQMLSDGIRGMTKVLPASATEIAAVGEAAGQLGIQTDNILGFTRTMIDLGESTNMTAETAATEFARFANIVGMSQKDFDRLGSVVVGLGNNLATTEAEIVSMAMRIAGAGAQIGLTEAEIMAFSGSLSSVGIAAEAGGSAFSKVMVDMQLASEVGGKKLNNFAKVAGMSASDFKKAFQEDAAGAIISFIEGLSTAEERGISAIKVLDDMGIKEVRLRDTLLRAAGATDVFTDAIEMGSKAWDENVALTEEAEQRYATTESQLKITWNRVKDMAITLGDALVPAVMSAIDAAEPLIQKIESGARAFSEMDESQQQTILKMLAFVAAVGPASVVAGGFTTTLGGMSKIAGSLARIIGTKSGTGLVARIGTMALGAGPIGLAVGGVAALGGVIFAASKYTKDLHDVNYDLIDSVNEEITSIKDLEDRFTELYGKNRLSSDEMLRYMDILSELEKTEGEEAIKKLSDEQANLLEKSGFTNAEMEEFIGLNNEIVETTPNVTSAISDQGNAFIDNLEILKELNAEKIEMLMIDAQRELTKALENENQLLQDQISLENEINEIQQKIRTNQGERLAASEELTQAEIRQEEINQEIAALKEEMKTMDVDALLDANTKLSTLEQQRDEERGIIEDLEQQKDKLDEIFNRLMDNLDTKNDELDVNKEQLSDIEKMIADYETLILKQVGLNSEKGEGLDALDTELAKIDEQQKELDKKNTKIKGGVIDYEEQNKKLSTQRQRLLDAQKELEEINRLAGKTIYDKKVKISSEPSIDNFNRQLSSPLTRFINLRSKSMPIAANADGTDYHPGGLSWLGEEGPELIRKGNNWAMADFGLYDLPRGYQVFTHDESKRILNAMNRMPAYANGTNMGAETNRIVNGLNNQQSPQSNQPIVLEIHMTNEMDGRVLSKSIERYITEIQDINKKVVESFA